MKGETVAKRVDFEHNLAMRQLPEPSRRSRAATHGELLEHTVTKRAAQHWVSTPRAKSPSRRGTPRAGHESEHEMWPRHTDRVGFVGHDRAAPWPIQGGANQVRQVSQATGRWQSQCLHWLHSAQDLERYRCLFGEHSSYSNAWSMMSIYPHLPYLFIHFFSIYLSPKRFLHRLGVLSRWLLSQNL